MSLPNAYVKILTPEAMVPGGGAFGRCLSHEGGDFENGINVLMFAQETPHRAALLP